MPLRWIEHYPEHEGRIGEWSLVRFSSWEAEEVCLGGVRRRRLGSPRWSHLAPEEAEGLTGAKREARPECWSGTLITKEEGLVLATDEVYDVAVVGSGAAGYAAAVQAAWVGLSTLVFQSFESGGQLMLSDRIENYPGIGEGTTGPDLADAMEEQALPYSDMDIEVPDEFATQGNTKVATRFRLPKSLWIVAAMNSSDRSVAPLDAAMRRRFAIINMMPDYDALRSHIGATTSTFPDENTDWEADDVLGLTVSLLRKLNERLEAVLGPDFVLGQSHLWHVSGHTRDEVLDSLSRAMDKEVIPTLRMMFTDHDEGLAAVLKAAGTSETASTSHVPNRLCYWSKPAEDLGAVGYPRLRHNLLSSMSFDNALSELRRLTGV